MHAHEMVPESYAWKRIGEALTSKPQEFGGKPPRTDERYGDPTLPPNAEKKRAYWIWFAAIIVLESSMIRRAMFEMNDFTEKGVWNQFLLQSQLLNIVTHLIVDLTVLRALNAFGGYSGLSFPSRLNGAPVLNASEENTLLFRHLCKLIQRNPLVNSMLLGGKPDGFHAYEVKQILLMVLSPTFFGVLFAVKSTGGLMKMACINVMFINAHVLIMPFAFKYTEQLRSIYFEKLGPEDVWRKKFALIGVVVAVAPFISSVVVRVMKWEFRSGDGTRLEKTMADETAGVKQQVASQHEKTRNGADIPRVRQSTNRLLGLRPDGGTELSASTMCFKDSDPQFVVVRQPLNGVTLRVTFDGRVLHTSSEPTKDPATGETHTLLKVQPPEWLDLSDGNGPPTGLAWVTTGRKNHQSSFRRGLGLRRHRSDPQNAEKLLQQLWNDDSFVQAGQAVPLLFLENAEVAREVNSVVSLIARNMDGVKANRLVMRLGNCITKATYNARDMADMKEVARTMGMKLCEKMLHRYVFLSRKILLALYCVRRVPLWRFLVRSCEEFLIIPIRRMRYVYSQTVAHTKD